MQDHEGKDIVYIENPLKKKKKSNFWRNFAIAFVGTAISVVAFIDNLDYSNRNKSIRESYQIGNYQKASQECLKQSENNLPINLFNDRKDADELKQASKFLTALEDTTFTNNEKRKLKQNIETLIASGTQTDVLNLVKYVGSYSKDIDSLATLPESKQYLDRVNSAAFSMGKIVTNEEKAFLVKVLLQYKDNIPEENNNDVDYVDYYEKTGESMLYRAAIADSTEDQNTYFRNSKGAYIQAVNYLINEMAQMVDYEQDQAEIGSDDIINLRIQELSTKLNSLGDYVLILKKCQD